MISCVTVGEIQTKQKQKKCFCMQECTCIMFMQANSIEFCRIDCENNLKSETALVPKLSPFTQLLLIKQRKPFHRSPSACSFFFFFSSSYFFLHPSFTMGPPSDFQQRTILKVYQQLLVNPFLPLCALFSGVPFPSSSPSGPARKESSVMALWRENGGIHPMLCR